MFIDIDVSRSFRRGLTCVFAVVSLLGSAAAVKAASHRELSFAVVNGAVAGVPGDTLSLQKDDDIVIKWTSDKPIELHLHGYDIEVKVTPQAPATMSFKARIPGRFPIEQHGQGPGRHKPVLYLEVQP